MTARRVWISTRLNVFVLGALLGIGLAVVGPVQARAQVLNDQPPPAPLPALDGQPQGAEVLTQGPIHEAFAEPVVFDPKPAPIVPKAPPPPVEESPPDQRPEGTNVVWIPGYWAWDDGRADFLWISGLWRDVPPGRQWVPGYWVEEPGNGYRWVAGAWVAAAPAQDAAAQTVEYLPAPPSSLEAGPSVPAPVAGAIWIPGTWLWQANRYVWRPGFWTGYQPDWVWVPAHYLWTPGGYLFVDGYWDRIPVRRGIVFAPVYFAQPVYQQPRFVYTPTISLVTTALVASLFVRPACHQYYFGDYYATTYYRSGIYPAYSFHQSRYGYDPMFAHAAAVNLRRDPAWLDHVHDDYRYRRDHPEARPPHTYTQLREVVNRSTVTNTNITNVNQTTVNVTRNLVLARPLSQIAANPRLASAAVAAPALAGAHPAEAQELRFTRLDEARRREATRQANDLRQFRQQRLREEAPVARPAATQVRREGVEPGARPRAVNPVPAANLGALDQPRRVNLARSPIHAATVPRPLAGNPGAGQLPANPAMPAVDLNARPRPANAAAIRPEPSPDQGPRHFPGAADAARLRQQQIEAMKARQKQQIEAKAAQQRTPPNPPARVETKKEARPRPDTPPPAAPKAQPRAAETKPGPRNDGRDKDARPRR